MSVAFFRLLLVDVLPAMGIGNFHMRWNIVTTISFPIMVGIGELWIRATRKRRGAEVTSFGNARKSSSLSLALLLSVLPACQQLGTGLAPPRVEPATPNWSGADPLKRLVAEVDPPGGALEIRSVFVRFARHQWPGVSAAHEVEAVRDGESDTFLAVLPDPLSLRPNMIVHYQWFVEYALPEGMDVETVSSDVLSYRADFPDNCTERLLTARDAIMALYDDPNPHQNPLLVQTHLLRSFEGGGVAWARADGGALWGTGHGLAAVGSGAFEPVLQLDQPALLLYEPDPEASLAELNDPHTVNAPYRLVGWGYGTLFDPTQQPTLECVPYEDWFIHEAGWHPSDGGFWPTPPPPDQIDTGVPAWPIPPVSPFTSVWHPRLWDLHVWLNEDEAPSFSILHPDPGLLRGAPYPAGTFFFPTREP